MDRPTAPVGEWLDRDLVIAFKAGDPNAYDEMYRRYGARVAGVCRRMLGNAEDAHEATQETFLKAYQALPRFNGNYKLGAWLARIAANVCLDQIRARSRRANVVPLHIESDALDEGPSPEDLVAYQDRAFATLDQMQPLHARALALRALEGMSHKEIADRLAMSPNQVKALLHRARDSFKRAWENASGWVFAPIFALRSYSDQGERNVHLAGVHASTFSATTAPWLAERVAASAIVVATAIAGVSGADVSTIEQTTVSNTPAAAAPRTVEADLPAIERQVAVPEERDVVASVVETLEEVVKSKTPTEDKEDVDRDKDDEGDGDVNPGDPDRASTALVRQIQGTVEDITP